MPPTREQIIERMKDRARAQPVSKLADALALLDAMPKLDNEHRLTRAVIIDVICERSPEAEAAFQAWAESDDNTPRAGSAAIVAAVRGSKTRTGDTT